MYRLVFGRPDKYVVLARGTLLQVAAKRELSGDLVITEDGKVSRSTVWLFEWEKPNPNCYARRMQKGWSH